MIILKRIFKAWLIRLINMNMNMTVTETCAYLEWEWIQILASRTVFFPLYIWVISATTMLFWLILLPFSWLTTRSTSLLIIMEPPLLYLDLFYFTVVLSFIVEWIIHLIFSLSNFFYVSTSCFFQHVICRTWPFINSSKLVFFNSNSIQFKFNCQPFLIRSHFFL